MESDRPLRELIDRLIDRQVCSPPQNACRNDIRIEEAIVALTAAEAENARLREALNEIAREELSEMMSPATYAGADFEVGYDCCIRVAREAIGETK